MMREEIKEELSDVILDLGDMTEDEKNTNNILDELKYYLENTPKEQVEKDWKEIQDWYSQHFTTNEKHNKEEELTEFEKRIYILINFSDPDNFPSIEEVKEEADILLDLARKELMQNISDFEIYEKGFKNGEEYALESLPKWKTYKGKLIGNGLIFEDNVNLVLVRNGYYIDINELEKLPKEK